MRRLGPLEAARLIRDRTIAVSGLELSELQQGAAVDRDADDVLRMLLADLVQPEDMTPLLEEVLLQVTQELISAVVPAVMAGLHFDVRDRDEPDENGNEHDVTVTCGVSEALAATLFTAIGQHIGVGLVMRREGDLIVPSTSPADDYRPSHWGRPEAE